MRITIEHADTGALAGWAEGDAPDVEIRVGGRLVGRAQVGDGRPDVGRHFGSDLPYRAFRYTFAEGDLGKGINAVRVTLAAARHDPAASRELGVFDLPLAYGGHCPSCGRDTTFRADSVWFRDSLVCTQCQSSVRGRALALMLERLRPGWRSLSLHESSPGGDGFSAVMRSACAGYLGSHYRPDHPFGDTVEGFRNENLERQTFADESFDLVVTLDVMEHVFDPAAVYAEVHRTLRPGGIYLHTFPIRKWLVDPVTPRVRLDDDGGLVHLAEPEYHGNPIDPQGSIVTYDYGYDIHHRIAEWAPFSVEVTRFNSEHHGILGEYTEVVACTKAGPPPAPILPPRSPGSFPARILRGLRGRSSHRGATQR